MKPFCGLLLSLAAGCAMLSAAPAGAAETDSDSATATQEKGRFEIPATDEGLPGAGPIRRAKWFQDIWSYRRSRFAKRAEHDQNALVFFGDSITQGWGENMGGSFPEIKVANRGIGGDTTRGMLIRLDEDVLSLHPSGVVMLMGTNDIDENASPETIAGNVELIIEELGKNDPDMPIILCLVFPSSPQMNRPPETITKLNELLTGIAKDHKQVTVVDTWTPFANAEGNAKLEEFPDLLHPNQTGYAKWAAALSPVLSKLGFPESQADN